MIYYFSTYLLQGCPIYLCIKFFHWGDLMKRGSKDSFVQGFVPDHNHGSVDYTGVADGHVHQCLDVTSPLQEINR